ncbi:hypothetical protein QBA54_07505 [Streptomyces sp. B21-108]|uniref:hypothetical protein n=1 Tax=Streptomyces sp. B21-108 TaxID=3039419 RepID=UPI002FEFB4B0
MSFLDRLLGNDQQRAATKYAGHESATQQAARQRRTGHRRSILGAARQGQAWEDADRQQERQRRGPYTQ